MISPESCSCIVSAGLRSEAGVTGYWDGARSCSGLLLDRQRGLVLCHAQILSPFLRQQQQLSRQPFLLPGAFHRDLQIQVQFRARTSPGGGRTEPRSEPLSESPSPDLNPEVPASGLVRSQGYGPATFLVAFPCLEFREAFQSLYHEADQWHFSLDDQEAALEDLAWFGLLQCPSWARGSQGGESLQYVSSELLRKGQTLFSCASPFASFWSEVFMNTFSKGIVSNLAGERNAVILTDARCLPGTEGGGIYLKLHGLYYLAGLIAAPLCWKAHEWVGLTLVCSITCIFKAIRRIWNALDKNGKSVSFCPMSGHLPLPSSRWQGVLTQLFGVVALLESDGVWGSGVVISPRLILTCRHVLGRASAVEVKIQPDSGSCLASKGRVLFATKDNSAYDVALVELEKDLLYVEVPVAASAFNTGIVSSNTRNNSAGACYPHLNFSLPITVLQPLLSRYKQTRDAAVFEELNQVNDRMCALWRPQDGFLITPKSKL
ncbi:peroxisomal leader peptide-processing protease isoform X2 [Stegostoma tigrinum]|uniref:peroxisomal leader peptide-processing protease isoform X2 n=1 Tax=Stegostoma tigrinum TaxID=3053191 RepID=UPI00202B2294|nr:peroxisomal leader peptide-processing protease isoform X2 [Stegostoma tigrinum]